MGIPSLYVASAAEPQQEGSRVRGTMEVRADQKPRPPWRWAPPGEPTTCPLGSQYSWRPPGRGDTQAWEGGRSPDALFRLLQSATPHTAPRPRTVRKAPAPP